VRSFVSLPAIAERDARRISFSPRNEPEASSTLPLHVPSARPRGSFHAEENGSLEGIEDGEVALHMHGFGEERFNAALRAEEPAEVEPEGAGDRAAAMPAAASTSLSKSACILLSSFL
jgi:hypothetical protein